MPKASTIAEWIVDGIAKTINDSGKTATLARYGDVAARTTDVQKMVVEWIKDGYITDDEAKEIKQKLMPLIEKAIDLI